MFAFIGSLGEGANVDLTIRRGEEIVEASLEPADLGDAFVVKRGLLFDLPSRPREVASVGDQAGLALDRTWHDLTTVVRTVQKLVTQQVPKKNLGGPILIAQALYAKTQEGLPEFLLLLTFLSANLAVLNFLPIPVLDGGHMVFLAWEGITGRPATEKVLVPLQVLGMVLLLTLMLYVTKNDIMRFF